MKSDPTKNKEIWDKLASMQITSIDDIWAQLGSDFDVKVDKIASDIGVPNERLLEFIADETKVDGGIRASAWFARVSLILGLLIYLSVIFLIQKPSRVAVAIHPLRIGHALQHEDIDFRWLRGDPDYLQMRGDWTGFILAHDVQEGRPLHNSDVLRLQVTALQDIAPHTLISEDAVALSWTPYDPAAETDLAHIQNRVARAGLRKNEVVIHQNEQILASSDVITTQELFPYHLISVDDLTGSFTQKKDFIGHYTLVPLDSGQTLEAELVSAKALNKEQENLFRNSRIVSIPLAKSEQSILPLPPAKVYLSNYLPQASDTSTAKMHVSGISMAKALLLNIQRQSGAVYVVLAIKADQVSIISQTSTSGILLVEAPGDDDTKPR